jgi:hypothetical protein
MVFLFSSHPSNSSPFAMASLMPTTYHEAALQARDLLKRKRDGEQIGGTSSANEAPPFKKDKGWDHRTTSIRLRIGQTDGKLVIHDYRALWTKDVKQLQDLMDEAEDMGIASGSFLPMIFAQGWSTTVAAGAPPPKTDIKIRAAIGVWFEDCMSSTPDVPKRRQKGSDAFVTITPTTRSKVSGDRLQRPRSFDRQRSIHDDIDIQRVLVGLIEEYDERDERAVKRDNVKNLVHVARTKLHAWYRDTNRRYGKPRYDRDGSNIHFEKARPRVFGKHPCMMLLQHGLELKNKIIPAATEQRVEEPTAKDQQETRLSAKTEETLTAPTFNDHQKPRQRGNVPQSAGIVYIARPSALPGVEARPRSLTSLFPTDRRVAAQLANNCRKASEARPVQPPLRTTVSAPTALLSGDHLLGSYEEEIKDEFSEW